MVVTLAEAAQSDVGLLVEAEVLALHFEAAVTQPIIRRAKGG